MRAAIRSAAGRAPKRFGPFHTTLWSSIGKMWTGNRDLHYEVWRRARLGLVEVGLHFESDALTNARLLGAFRAREAEVRAALGRAPLLEEWDKGWARVYESLPLAQEPAALGERLAAYVAALEPLLREELPADVRWRLGGRPATT